MKRLCPTRTLILTAFLFISFAAGSTTYYSKSTGNANATSNWGTNPDGSGTNPANFTSSGDLFIITPGSVLDLNGNWTIGAGVTLEVDGNLSITVNNRDITINGTIIFTATNATQVSLTGGGNGNNFTISSGATLKTANVNGIRGTNCSLPATASGTISLNSGATYVFNGTASQGDAGLPATIANLEIDNVSGVALNNNYTVSNLITLTNGILTVNAGQTLTLGTSNAIGGSGFGASKHIQTAVSGGNTGALKVNGINGTYFFPIGQANYYLPATVVTTAASSISVSTFKGITVDGTPNGTPFTTTQKNVSVDAVWNINRATGNGSMVLTASWPSTLEGSGFTALSGPEIGISQFTGSSWDAGIGTGNQSLKTATRSSIASPTKFVVNKIGVPLPLKFSEFRISGQGNTVQVSWTSLTELNIRNYDIERSQDGRNFTSIGSVSVAGNNFNANQYSFTDPSALSGTSFYRIRANDIDGKVNYSSIARITFGSITDATFTIYPNPVKGKQLNVQASGIANGQYQLLVHDANGKAVYKESLTHNGGSFSKQVVLPPSCSPGIYSIMLLGNGKSISKLIMVD